MSNRVDIEVWSDLVCPWCFIGKRRLDDAIAAFTGDAEVNVVHRAYQLDPSAENDGKRTADYLAEKYDITPEQALEMMDDVSEVAKTVGLDYDLAAALHGNTTDAHRLVLWAQTQGSADALLNAMYSGYFEHGRSLFTTDDLISFAVAAGLDGDQARIMLNSPAFTNEVVEEQQLAMQFGARGVPFFVFNRKYGISGAQGPEVFEQTLAKAAEG